MKWIFTFIILAVLVVLAAGMVLTQPDLTKQFVLAVDVLGITPLGQEEVTRRQKIEALPINYDQQQVLINRTVFLGATRYMVSLALGDPKKAVGSKDRSVVIYTYHFAGDPIPTTLTFKNDRLDKAQKQSDPSYRDD